MAQLQHLVQWVGSSEHDASWVTMEDLLAMDSQFGLKDKVILINIMRIFTNPTDEQNHVKNIKYNPSSNMSHHSHQKCTQPA